MATFYPLNASPMNLENAPPSEIPHRLAKRARKTSSVKDTLEREKRAAAARNSLIASKVETLKAHSESVAEVQKLKASFAANGLEILDNGKPVELPAHLKARIDALSKGTEGLLDKEKRASEARESLLASKVETLKAHSESVAEVQKLKASFAANGLEILDNGKPVELPAHLKARIDALSKGTEGLLEKEKRASEARESLLASKVAAARTHNESRVAEVRAAKAEFAGNGLEILDNGKPVELPAHLKARADALSKGTEGLLEKEKRASEARESLLASKVETLKAHSKAVANAASRKRKARDGETMEE